MRTTFKSLDSEIELTHSWENGVESVEIKTYENDLMKPGEYNNFEIPNELVPEFRKHLKQLYIIKNSARKYDGDYLSAFDEPLLKIISYLRFVRD